MEQVPPGTQEYPTAAWMQHHFNQTIAQSFLIPGVGAMENTPLPLKMSATETLEIPAEINMGKQSFRFLVISYLVSKWESITEIIQQCISWFRDL